ncbi:MAG TPA: S1/P1 nuclease [Balneolaceae bacterium]
MFFIILLSVLFLIPSGESHNTRKWGKTGHRIVGEVAAHYLTPKAQKAVNRVLGHESMAIASIWMDQIRSNPKYDYTHDWHWVTIPEGMTYAETEKNPNGDIIWAIQTIIDDLKSGELPSKKEERKLKMLIHLVGDIHQPLHVGTGKDMGGNRTYVAWFGESSNMHRVWDSDMIDFTKLSYTEYSAAINHPAKKQIKKWQNATVLDWAYEAMKLRDEVYDLPDRRLGYEYQYKHHDLLNRQLLKGGVRLAGVLNEIYG